MIVIFPGNRILVSYMSLAFMLGLLTPLLAPAINQVGHFYAAILLVGHIACTGLPIVALVRGRATDGNFCGYSAGLWPIASIVAYSVGFIVTRAG